MALIGYKLSMIVGSITYAAFIATFFYLNDWLLYGGSALIGVGAALIWTAQVFTFSIIPRKKCLKANF